jgi:hypothetical protein
MLGFKAFHSAAATLAGIETAHMIRKRQLGESSLSAFRQFAGLAAKLCPKLWPAQPSKKFATETDGMGSVMNSVYLVWPMRVSDMVTH